MPPYEQQAYDLLSARRDLPPLAKTLDDVWCDFWVTWLDIGRQYATDCAFATGVMTCKRLEAERAS
jgi:hypothetical protein